MRSFLLFLHLVSVALWIGGMFFAHFCLRPAAIEALAPPQRLPLLVAALARFFRWVAVAIVLLWISGLARLSQVGFAAAPPSWHAMLGIALVMTVIFAVIAHVIFPQVRTLVGAQKFPEAGARMDTLRLLVAVNLALGVATIGVATIGL